MDYFESVGSHALAGGVIQVLGGGKFGHGFVTAGVGAALSPVYQGNRFERAVQASIVGGTLSEVTGGKFANGALTTAFAYAFNFDIHQALDGFSRGRTDVDSEAYAAQVIAQELRDDVAEGMKDSFILALTVDSGVGLIRGGFALLRAGLAPRAAAAAATEFGTTAARSSLIKPLVTSDGALKTSETVARQLAEQRSFIPTQSILETIGSGVRYADPQGVAGQFMYRAEAVYNGSVRTLEVLVDEANGVINHVLYR